VHAAIWPEGFRTKSPVLAPRGELPVAAPELAQPAAHVMPAWEPSQQVAHPVARRAELLADPVSTRRALAPRMPKAVAPEVTARGFADPFADDDSGANCIRCGLLVEAARENRGLLTCAKCG
jgi:hypothetical protein